MRLPFRPSILRSPRPLRSYPQLHPQARVFRQAFRSFQSSASLGATSLPQPPLAAHTGLLESCVDLACALPHELILSIHNAGLSWGYAIPITALILRAFVIAPFIQLPTRRAQQRYIDIQPLCSAWRNVLGDAHRKLHFKNPVDYPLKQAYEESKAAISKQHRRVRKIMKCTITRRLRNFWQLPILFTLVETIRRMLNADFGLLNLLVQTFSSNQAIELSLERADVIQALYGTKVTAWFEPTMIEGGILWFTDLTAADPTCMLSAMVAAVTFGNVYRSSKPPPGMTLTTSRLYLRRGLLALSLAMFPLTLEMPSGLLWYWFSSTASGWAAYEMIDRVAPLSKPVPRALGSGAQGAWTLRRPPAMKTP